MQYYQQRLQNRHQHYQRKYPHLSPSQISSLNNRDKRKVEVYQRRCVVCNCDSSKTLWVSRRRPRVDGTPHVSYPMWYRSKLEQGAWECVKCYRKEYWEKNKHWIKARMKRRYEQRKRLHDFKMKSITRMAKVGRKKEKNRKS